MSPTCRDDVEIAELPREQCARGDRHRGTERDQRAVATASGQRHHHQPGKAHGQGGRRTGDIRSP